MKKLLSILLATLILTLSGLTVFAGSESKIIYEGGADKYVALPGSEFTESDTFQPFKNLMPGDVASQDIIVTSTKKNYQVKIYMKAIPHNDTDNTPHEAVIDFDENLKNAAADQVVPTMEDFLKQLSMNIVLDGKKIYDASPDELDGLKDFVLLGTFNYGDQKTLKVNLSVPIDLDNKYAYRAGEVDWVFKAEEIYIPPVTGDRTKIVLYVGLAVVAVLGILAMIIVSRKKKAA